MRAPSFRFGLILTLLAGPVSDGKAANPHFNAPIKAPPKRTSIEPDIQVEWFSILKECPKRKVCVQGQLYNAGPKTAHHVRLKVNIGGTKHIKPETSFFTPLENHTMEPGDRQEFYFEVKRKLPYRKRGETHYIYVGKYNVNVVPIWSGKKPHRGKK